jgi:hypothetical protein
MNKANRVRCIEFPLEITALVQYGLIWLNASEGAGALTVA